MRSRWQNFENKQSQKAIVDSACNLKIVHIEVTLWLLLAGITMSLSGCVVTYRDFPNATLESLPKNHEPKPLYYHVEPMAGTILLLIPSLYPQFSNIDPIGQPGYHQVAQTLEASGLFSALLVVPDLPETGVYCSIDFEVRMPSALWSGSDLRLAFYIVLGLLPYYTGEGGTTVVYTLCRDGQLKQTYRYSITKNGAGWIVLLPFAWVNFFTNDLKDAVRGATLQFLIDADRDGNL
jgi:hypothetical protein